MRQGIDSRELVEGGCERHWWTHRRVHTDGIITEQWINRTISCDVVRTGTHTQKGIVEPTWSGPIRLSDDSRFVHGSSIGISFMTTDSPPFSDALDRNQTSQSQRSVNQCFTESMAVTAPGRQTPSSFQDHGSAETQRTANISLQRIMESSRHERPRDSSRRKDGNQTCSRRSIGHHGILMAMERQT